MIKLKLKRIVAGFIIINSFVFNSISQEIKEDEKPTINLSGYIKSDFIFDTRQTFSSREGHFLFWPLPVKNDVNDEDINAKPNFNFLALQSRLTLKVKGPDVFNAKSSGAVEGDFFGQANDNINLFRLRQAFVRLNWTNTELLLGQYWNPMFVTKCYPEVLSFNTGVPFQPFAQNPQIRLTQKLGNINLLFAALSQRDYSTKGPSGSGSEYLRNSAVPEFHFQVHFEDVNSESGTGIYAGAGISYKTIVPRLYSEVTEVAGYDSASTITGKIVHISDVKSLYKVNEKLSSMSASGYIKYKAKSFTIKAEGVYGENSSDVLSIGGFAVKGITDTITGEKDYTPLKNISFWCEIFTNGKKIQAGLFAGYTKNLGTKDEISGNSVYALAPNIESVYRIAPRIAFISNKFKTVFEIEYTNAAFGSTNSSGLPVVNNYGEPENVTEVHNIRFITGVYYFF